MLIRNLQISHALHSLVSMHVDPTSVPAYEVTLLKICMAGDD